MLKFISLKTISAGALSLSLLLGAFAATPATSAFAKIKFDTTPARDRGAAYNDKNLDNDGDELNESSEQPMIILYTTTNWRAEGKRVLSVGK